MPNQRDPIKKHIGAWFTPEEIDALDKAVVEAGCTDRADFIRLRLRQLERGLLEISLDADKSTKEPTPEGYLEGQSENAP